MPEPKNETLRGREIILAGGTGGLGAVTASLLSQEGAAVILSYRADHERAERIGQNLHVIQADLGSEDERTSLLDAAPELYGLVILAGDPSRGSNLSATLPRSFETNFVGPVMLAREAADRMKARGTPGAIVILGTMQASALFANSTAYAAQKAALVHAARILAKELRGPANIRVNVVNPGVTNAGMARASVASGKYESYLRDGAIPRYGEAADVARAIRFLLEPDNYITGQVLTVDGGLTL
jgi:glucose 1-dehydrogenase